MKSFICTLATLVSLPSSLSSSCIVPSSDTCIYVPDATATLEFPDSGRSFYLSDACDLFDTNYYIGNTIPTINDTRIIVNMTFDYSSFDAAYPNYNYNYYLQGLYGFVSQYLNSTLFLDTVTQQVVTQIYSEFEVTAYYTSPILNTPEYDVVTVTDYSINEADYIETQNFTGTRWDLDFIPLLSQFYNIWPNGGSPVPERVVFFSFMLDNLGYALSGKEGIIDFGFLGLTCLENNYTATPTSVPSTVPTSMPSVVASSTLSTDMSSIMPSGMPTIMATENIYDDNNSTGGDDSGGENMDMFSTSQEGPGSVPNDDSSDGNVCGFGDICMGFGVRVWLLMNVIVVLLN